MASRKNAKKDILFFIEEVLEDCLIYLELHQDKEYPEVEGIIDDMEQLYQEAIYRVNHIDVEEKKNTKKYFDGIYDMVLDGVHDAFDRLSKLAKA
jgi:acyl-ACP thioesterase